MIDADLDGEAEAGRVGAFALLKGDQPLEFLDVLREMIPALAEALRLQIRAESFQDFLERVHS